MARWSFGIPGWTLLLGTLVVASLALAANSAHAQDPAAQVDARQEQMKRLGGAMKTSAAFLKGEGGTVADVKAAAATVAEVGTRMANLFPQGTGVGVGDSEALPAIWENPDKFAAAIAAMSTAAPKLAAAVDTGDKAVIGAAVKGVGGACAGCHESFRVKK